MKQLSMHGLFLIFYSFLNIFNTFNVLGFDVENIKWELLSTGPWYSREGLMGVVYNNYVYMSGGRNDKTFYNDVWRMNGSCNVNITNNCQWELLTSNAQWSPRGYHIMIEHNNYMYILAGQNYTIFYNDIWRSTDGINWQQILDNNYNANITSTQYTPRAGLAAISYNNVIYVMAGCRYNPPNRELFNDVWISQDDGLTWKLYIEASSWLPRSGARIQVYNNYLYLVAGEFGFSSPTQYDDVWRIQIPTTFNNNNNDNNDWELITRNPGWDKRSGHGFVIDNNTGIFYVIAGYFDKHDLWQSITMGSNWTLSRNDVFNCNDQSCGRYDFWSLIYKQYLIIYGGDGDYSTFGGEYNETWRLNINP